MSKQRSAIKIFPHERPLLIDAYVRRQIPVDQYETRPDELADLTKEWNKISGRNDAPADVLHYIRTQRKRGLWVRLDGNHKPMPPSPEMTAEECEILIAIYRDHVADFAHGSDFLGYDPEVADLLAKEFSAEVGRIFPAHQVIAKLTALRKRGYLPRAAPHPKDTDEVEDIGFDDINQVGLG